MTFEISKFGLMDRVREKKEIEDAIAAQGEGNDSHDLGSYLSIEYLMLVGGSQYLDPEIHSSYLQTNGSGPTSIILIEPLPLSIGLRKLIFCGVMDQPGDDISLNPGGSIIKTDDGNGIISITFTSQDQWLLLEAWDTNYWRVVRSSGVTIV